MRTIGTSSEGDHWYGNGYDYNGMIFSRRYDGTRFKVFGSSLKHVIEDLLIPWGIRHLSVGAGLRYAVANRYSNGYRATFTFPYNEHVDLYGNVIRKDQEQIIVAIDRNGRLLGWTSTRSLFYNNQWVLEEKLTRTVDWTPPNLIMPNDLHEFIRPPADLISGIEVMRLEERVFCYEDWEY